MNEESIPEKMPEQKKSNNLWLLIAVLILSIIAFAYFVYQTGYQEDDADYSTTPASSEQVEPTQAEQVQSEVDNAITETDQAIEEMDELINTPDSAPQL